MIDLDSFAGQPVAVMGLGRSGLAAALALSAGGAEVRGWDDGEAARRTASEAGLALADLSESKSWTGVRTLVLSPGIPHTHPKPHPSAVRAREAGAEIIGDVELLLRSRPTATLIGITGTNGKSTTTALIGHILKQAGRAVEIGGNLGRPVCEFGALDSDGFYVLELSSYQLELAPSLACDVAVLTNISPDHLDRHGGMAGYVAAKRRIVETAKPDASVVIGLDDPHSLGIYEQLRAASAAFEICGISSQRRIAGGVYVVDGMLHDDRDGRDTEILSLADIDTLPGTHNHQNAAAAFAALSSPMRRISLKSETIVDGIRSFPGLSHRQELVAIIDGVKYINDSKATNAEAAARALACYERIYWIAGGRAKEGGLSALDPHLPRIRRAFLIGEGAERMAAELRGRVDTDISGDLGSAVRDARDAALREGLDSPVVLLSPACASFDQFKDFEARGTEFRRLVAALPGGTRRVLRHVETA